MWKLLCQQQAKSRTTSWTHQLHLWRGSSRFLTPLVQGGFIKFNFISLAFVKACRIQGTTETVLRGWLMVALDQALCPSVYLCLETISHTMANVSRVCEGPFSNAVLRVNKILSIWHVRRACKKQDGSHACSHRTFTFLSTQGPLQITVAG